MNTKPIYITREDQLRLKTLATMLTTSGVKSASLVSLQSELRRATVVDAATLPTDVVALDSRVSIRDVETGEIDQYTLTLPEDAHRGKDSISVLAPIGIALLGYAVADEVVWQTPGGTRRIRIETVVQNKREKTMIPPYEPDFRTA